MYRYLMSAIVAIALAFAAHPAHAQESMQEEPAKKAHADHHKAALIAPPGGAFQPVSELVDLPDFLPGIGTLYVDPATLPAGPFLAYDRDGALVSSIYMIPLSAMNEQQSFDELGIAGAKADHVDIYYNAGHPGVDEPHYHFVVWTVSPEKAATLSE